MKTKTENYPALKPGCYVDYSALSADGLNRRILEFAGQFGFVCEPMPPRNDDDYPQILNETARGAVEFLSGLETRTGMYWTVVDNSLFLTVSLDDARESCEFVSSKEQDYPPDDYTGEWLHVSDHGNATLYVRENGKDSEIWGIV